MSANGFGKLIGIGLKAGYKMPPFSCYFAVFFSPRVNNSYSPYRFPPGMALMQISLIPFK